MSHVVRLTAEMSVVRLSTYVNWAEKICCFNPHTSYNFAFSRRQFGRFDAHNTWQSLYTKTSQVVEVTDSEANAIDRGEQRKSRSRGKRG